jgi:hypothetical protein
MFFFEKKNQRTFVKWRIWQPRRRSPTVMPGQGGIHALPAKSPHCWLTPTRPTPPAEGNKSFFASFCSQKEASYLLHLPC